jgi:adenosine deaminase
MTAFFSPPADPLLKSLPKANIHTHLEGSVRPQTLFELAQEQGVDLGIPAQQVEAALQVSGEERDLVDYLRKIGVTYPLLKNAAALQRTACEAAEDAALDGVIYLELRAGPVTHCTDGLPLEEAIQSMLSGLGQAEREHGIVARLIVTALRSHDPAANLRLAQVAVAYRDAGVVGFDLADDEAHYPAELHRQALHTARQGGLGLTVHAGEAAGAETVRYAVQELGADRIGHGVHSIEDPSVLELLRQRRILLEICPTSNVHTNAVPSLDQHPVRQLYDLGIPISIGDDDPVTSRTRLSNELTLLSQHFAFSLSDLWKIQQMTLQASFLQDEALRASLLEHIDQAWGASAALHQ